MSVLCLTPRIPYPPAGGDKLRAYHLIKQIALNGKVVLATFVENAEQLDLCKEMAEDMGIEHVAPVMLTKRQSWINCVTRVWNLKPLQVNYYYSLRMRETVNELFEQYNFDSAYVHLIRMAQYIKHRSDCRRLLDMTDAVSMSIERSLPYRKDWFSLANRLERSLVKRYERKVGEFFDVTTVIADADREYLKKHRAKYDIEVLGNGIDNEHFVPVEESRKPGTVTFLGNMHSFPNQDAVRFFIDDIWPLVRGGIDGAEFRVVGINVPPSIKVCHGMNGVNIVGAVDDVRPYVGTSEVFAAPMRVGAGVQNKILEAMALGIPTVTTSVGLEGLGAKPGRHLLVSDDPREFAEAIIRLMEDHELAGALSEAGREFVHEHFSWDRQGGRLRKLLSGVI